MQAAPRKLSAAAWLPGLVVALCIGAVAVQPYFLGRLVNGSDTYYHVHRLWQLHQMLDQGVLFSRWTPDLAYGFGAPLFNYYGPLTYYFADIFVRLTGSLVGGYLVALTLVSLAAAAGTYLWLRDVFGDWGALVGAAAFSMTPYIVTNILIRGTLAEPLAYAAMPFVLLSINRILSGHGRYVLLGAPAYAVIALSHNATLLLFTPSAVAYAAVLIIAAAMSKDNGVRAMLPKIGRVAWMFGLGLGLAAFFLIPVLLESGLVSLDKLYLVPELDYHNNFITLLEQVSNPSPRDIRLTGAPYPLHLGLTIMLLAACGLLWVLRGRSGRLSHVAAAGLILPAFMFMMSGYSVAIWDAVPLLRVLQFARRFLPVAGLYAALLAGAGLSWFVTLGWATRRTWVGPVLGCAALIGIVASNYPLQFGEPRLPLDYAPTALSITNLERQNGVIGTTLAGEYLPATVRELPAIDRSPLLRAGKRLDASSLSAGDSVVSEQYDPLRYDVTLDLQASRSIVFNTFFFPGWRTSVDGAAIEAAPSAPNGLIQLTVPAGRHQVVVEFVETPLRLASDLISLAALLALGATAAWSLRRPALAVADRLDRLEPLSWPVAVVPLVVIAVLFGAKTFIVDVRDTPFNRTRFDGQNVDGLAQPASVNFNNTLIFLGAEMPAQVRSGDVMAGAIYLRPAQALAADYSVSLQVVSPAGDLVGQVDHQHPASAPTRSWPAGNYARDPFVIRIFPGTPPGQYALRLAVYPYGASDKLQPILDAAGSVSGVQADIGVVDVIRPGAPASAAELAPQQAVEVDSGAGVVLIGYDFAPAPAPARTGEDIPLTLYLRVIDKDKAQTAAKPALLLSPTKGAGAGAAPQTIEWVDGYGTADWRTGDAWRARHRLFVPAGLASGEYDAVLKIGARQVTLGRIAVVAPEHVMIAPPVGVAQAARFGEIAELAGFRLDAGAKAGQPVSVTLVWKAAGETAVSYKVFTHLIDESGKLVAADDAIPAGWTRSTRSWMLGEYIADSHLLQVPADAPAGVYSLRIGLYDEKTGARLALPDGGQELTLSAPVTVTR